MRGGVARDRERFPGLRERLGEDPARWLDAEILGTGTKHIDGRSRMVRTRIESIDRIEVVRAWKAVERRLGRSDDGGPRSGIIQALDEREGVLEEIGERPERLTRREESRDLAPVETKPGRTGRTSTRPVIAQSTRDPADSGQVTRLRPTEVDANDRAGPSRTHGQSAVQHPWARAVFRHGQSGQGR